jgi:hypothetical protein
MTSRERLLATLNHTEPDRLCVDFGAGFQTGIGAAAVHGLREALFGRNGQRVKVIEPYQMLGEIDEALRQALGLDVVGVHGPGTMFGFNNDNWKPFTLFDGTPVFVPGRFNVTPADDGGWLMYPEGDTTAPPCAWMAEGTYFFDSLNRQQPLDEARLDPADNCKELGGGSLTALPIIETEAQNISAYIPTNLISITDGQIYLSPSLFELGVLPAVDVGKSVSRVGGKAQRAAYRVVAGDLKLGYAQFEELETFARFGARLDQDTRKIIEHGRRIRACLKQPEFAPVSVPAQIAVLLALTAELFDPVPLDQMTNAEHAVHEAAASIPTEACARFETADKLSDEDRKTIIEIARKALTRFQPKPEAKPEATAESKTQAESKAESKPTAKAEPKPEAKSKPGDGSQPGAPTDAKPNPKSETEPKPEAALNEKP